ncbi:MAG: hypothetical protein V2I27_14865 [Erythrobacter sp.]|jgi:hypothetical protein|nr:hypothetical protein [Erythrobacter sp.]
MALTPHFSRHSAGALGLAAALAMAATPSSAAQLPTLAPSASPLALTFDTSTYDPAAEAADWRRCGWRGCWGGGWRGRGRRGVSAGDVLAGVAIVGGIAAIASAANNNRRRERDVVIVDRDRDFDRERYDERDYERDLRRDRELEELRRRTDEQQREIEYLRSRGLDAERLSGTQARRSVLPPVTAPLTIDGAIDRCTEVVGIDASVAGIDGVDRTGTGWSVRGRLTDGQSFSCDIGNDGQIERLGNGAFSEVGSQGWGGYQELRAEGQWSDDRYSDARGSLASAAPAYGQPLVPLSAERMPAYPGGPLPGEQ